MILSVIYVRRVYEIKYYEKQKRQVACVLLSVSRPLRDRSLILVWGQSDANEKSAQSFGLGPLASDLKK